MSRSPNRLTRFWNELKRRRVIHVITVYASVSFVIIELINNLNEPLNLPPNLAMIVIIVLAVGFPLTVILSWIYDLTGEGVERTRPISEVPDEQVAKVSNAWKLATLISFLVIIGLATINIVGRTGKLRSGDIQSILILPFKNYTGDNQWDIVISGMHSSLIGNVGQITNLTVISPITSEWFNDVDMTLPEIAARAGVDAVVVPVVTCLGDSMCFEFQMITPDEKLRWFGEFHEAKSQIMNLQNQVTKQIADKVKIELTADEEYLLAESRTIDPNAVDAYMKGRYYLNIFTPEALDSAQKYFELAKEIEPGYVLAYTGICDVWAYRQQWGLVSPAEGNPRSMEALMKAYALDSINAVVQYSLALKKTWGMFDWAGGETGFIKSLSLNPNDALTHAMYSHFLNIVGRPQEALEQIDIALKLDPMNPFIMTFNGVDLNMARKYDEAIIAYDDALSIAPGYPFALANLWQSYYMVGRTETAYTILRSFWSSDDPQLLASLEQGYQKEGFTGGCISLADRLGEVWTDNPNQFFAPTDIAMLYSAARETDKSIYWLEEAYKYRDPNLPYLLLPVYDNVRNDPGFQDLMDRMNFPKY